MVNCMCQSDWATGCPGTYVGQWSSGCSWKVFLDETAVRLGALNKTGCLPGCWGRLTQSLEGGNRTKTWPLLSKRKFFAGTVPHSLRNQFLRTTFSVSIYVQLALFLWRTLTNTDCPVLCRQREMSSDSGPSVHQPCALPNLCC